MAQWFDGALRRFWRKVLVRLAPIFNFCAACTWRTHYERRLSGSLLSQPNLRNLRIFAVCKGVRAKLHSYHRGNLRNFALPSFAYKWSLKWRIFCLKWRIFCSLEVTYILLEVTYILLTHVSAMGPFCFRRLALGSRIVLVLLLLTSVIDSRLWFVACRRKCLDFRKNLRKLQTWNCEGYQPLFCRYFFANTSGPHPLKIAKMQR
jgi:hypothetical protein